MRLLLDQGFTIASQGAGDDEVALFPDEGTDDHGVRGRAAMQVVVNRYERDRQARQGGALPAWLLVSGMRSGYGHSRWRNRRFYPYPPSHSAGRDQAGLPSEPETDLIRYVPIAMYAAPARSAVYSPKS